MTSINVQPNGLPSVTALEAMDRVILDVRRAARSIFSDIYWNSFHSTTSSPLRDGYDDIQPLHQALEDTAEKLETIRNRFRIREVPPAEPKREVVRV